MNDPKLWKALVGEVSLTKDQYERAELHYESVGEWLSDADGILGAGQPNVYVHGSFRLGTAIRPLGEEGSYDIDMACVLEAASRRWGQETVKGAVGDRLKTSGRYEPMLEKVPMHVYQHGNRRCWTLHYAPREKFHLDVLPAVPDEEQRGRAHSLMGGGGAVEQSAVQMTDRTTWEAGGIQWPCANPKGYAIWFEGRCGQSLLLEKTLWKSQQGIQLSVEDIPSWRVHTPLQGVVQLLKRHRDVRMGKDEHRPISMVITTLAAEAFDPSDDLAGAMEKLPEQMMEHLRTQNWEVRNPVDPRENFTDKWKEQPVKRERFIQWARQLQEDVDQILRPGIAISARLEEMAARWAPGQEHSLRSRGNELGLDMGLIVSGGMAAGRIEAAQPGQQVGPKPWRNR